MKCPRNSTPNVVCVFNQATLSAARCVVQVCDYRGRVETTHGDYTDTHRVRERGKGLVSPWEDPYVGSADETSVSASA